MAVERVAKVLVAVHQDSRDRLVREVQKEALLHITSNEMKESTGFAEMDRKLGRLVEAIEQLDAVGKKKKGLFGAKPAVSRYEFEQLAREYDADKEVERLAGLNRSLSELDTRLKGIQAERKRLEPWKNLKYRPQELYALAGVVAIPGSFQDETELGRVREALSGLPAEVQLVEAAESGVSAVVLVAADHCAEVNAVLSSARFEPADLRAVRSLPSEMLAELAGEEEKVLAERSRVQKQAESLTEELTRLKVAADALSTERAAEAVSARFGRTRSVTVITGWVKERDYPRLEQLVEQTGQAVMCRLKPEQGEEPPVALVNRKLFRPFELVLELFSLPSPREIDPTVLLAPFFALFFAFCLTDAGYGIVVAVLAWLLLRKMGSGNKLLGMILIGGVVTVFAGAMVGGWFGDLPDRLGVTALLELKNKLMLFDPIKDPMPFFILSIGFGYLHMIFGMMVEIFDCLRVRQYGDALLGQLPWFLALNGILAIVVLGKSLPAWASAAILVAVLTSVAAILVFTRRSAETMAAQWLWFALIALVLVFFVSKLGSLPAALSHTRWMVLAVLLAMYAFAAVDLARAGRLKALSVVLGVVGLAGLGAGLAGIIPGVLGGVLCLPFLFSAPANRALVKKFLWGGYALYGATSYIGVVLSYIRIMALGMVTGGIAMAINTIAWMVLPIPVLGVVLCVIALVFGHTYNIAVNVLGAFVHTLRLNYVEFFPRFYSGGGEPFVPLREEHNYVSILQEAKS